jgi:hypothetical protein
MAVSGKTEQSWEKRSILFILRAIGVILFLAYLAVTGPSALSWGELKWVRFQPLEQITQVAERSIKRDPQDLVKWVSMRPSYERKQIMEKLEPYSGQISSGMFLIYSHWMMDSGQEKEAIFWRQYGRYRLRYDALRCGSPQSTKTWRDFCPLPDRGVQEAIAKDPSIVKISLQRVLDFDAKYPADNNPIDICPTIQKLDGGKFAMVKREDWRTIRHTLRLMTEYAPRENGRKESRSEKIIPAGVIGGNRNRRSRNKSWRRIHLPYPLPHPWHRRQLS